MESRIVVSEEANSGLIYRWIIFEPPKFLLRKTGWSAMPVKTPVIAHVFHRCLVECFGNTRKKQQYHHVFVVLFVIDKFENPPGRSPTTQLIQTVKK
jgi:hypothetical protein